LRNRKFWEIKNMEGSSETAEVKIYGEIVNIPCWEGDVSANSFERELNKFPDAEKIVVRINSPGGDVFEAQAIYNILKNHSAEVEVRIDALAASAATIIASAGDKVIMPDNALYMIHNPLSWASGYSSDMRKKADLLDTVKDTIMNVYRSKSPLEAEGISQMMDEETWMTAEQAYENGFVTEVITSKVESEAVEEVENFMRGQIMATFGKMPTGKFKNLLKSKKNIKNRVKEEDVKNMNLEEVKKNHPDLYNQILNEGKTTADSEAVAAERERVANLSNLKNIPGAAELVDDAIKNGMSVAECSMAIANSDAVKNIGKAKAEKEELKEDITNSGAEEVKPGASPTAEEEEEAKIKNETDLMVNLVKQKSGGRG